MTGHASSGRGGCEAAAVPATRVEPWRLVGRLGDHGILLFIHLRAAKTTRCTYNKFNFPLQLQLPKCLI